MSNLDNSTLSSSFSVYMLYKKRVFTLTQLASNSSTYLVSTVLTGLTLLSSYSGISRFFDRYFAAFQQYKTLVIAILFSVLTILVFNLLKILANNLFVKDQHAREVILGNFSQAITRSAMRAAAPRCCPAKASARLVARVCSSLG